MNPEEQSRYNEMTNLKNEYLNINAPEHGKKQMIEAITKARKDKNKIIKIQFLKKAGFTAAAAITLLVITPNVSRTAAMAMGNLPVIGPVIKVITIRNYKAEDEHYNANVSVPGIETNADSSNALSSSAIEKINSSTEEYINTLVSSFKDDIAENAEANRTLDIDYETVTDSDTWFTLKLSVFEAQASGFQSYRYYHINKLTGKMASLKDLFTDGADYKTSISNNIKQQMTERMSGDDSLIYWLNDTEIPENNFELIKDDQNFYFNSNGELVISFDEYEVAPGYMGAVEFTIPDSVIDEIRLR